MRFIYIAAHKCCISRTHNLKAFFIAPVTRLNFQEYFIFYFIQFAKRRFFIDLQSFSVLENGNRLKLLKFINLMIILYLFDFFIWFFKLLFFVLFKYSFKLFFFNVYFQILFFKFILIYLFNLLRHFLSQIILLNFDHILELFFFFLFIQYFFPPFFFPFKLY